MMRNEFIRLYKEGKRDFLYADLMDTDLRRANLRHANLSGADLSGANLQRTTLCGATIDGAILDPDDIGGPGHILCALTDTEWAWVKQQREEAQDE